MKKIQNAGLGEHAIRDLNDTINKLIREKYHWNRRILELSKGKKDYNTEERKAMVLAEKEGGTRGDGDGDLGSGIKGSGGYRYFGAAKVIAVFFHFWMTIIIHSSVESPSYSSFFDFDPSLHRPYRASKSYLHDMRRN